MNLGEQKNEASLHSDEAKHGRHDAHKHHDTMGEIVQSQGHPDNVKNKHVDLASLHNDEAKHGRHDAHKHHDTMGEIVQSQGHPDNVKNKHVDLVDTQVKEVNPHSESLCIFQVDKLRNNLRSIIDEIGKSSAIAQHLEHPITSAQKLLNSDHVIYMMTEQNTLANFAVIGFLKMGRKKLSIYNKQDTCSETLVYCILDFYIYESKQRQGYGKRLIEYMLQDVKLHARNLVMDKPTTNLLQFMLKNFQLSKLVNQGNNFAIYEDFFDEFNENHDNTGNRTSGYNRPPTFGRHGAHKHHDSMGEILQTTGPSSPVINNHSNQFVHKEIKPHAEEALGSLQINKYGDYVERDLKYYHSST